MTLPITGVEGGALAINLMGLNGHNCVNYVQGEHIVVRTTCVCGQPVGDWDISARGIGACLSDKKNEAWALGGVKGTQYYWS